MNVFSSEMHIVTLIVIIIQIIAFVVFAIEYLKEPANESTKRFIYFTLLFIVYNFTSGIFPDKEITINIFIQLIIAYSTGIFLAIYYVYYLYTEFEIKQIRFFSVKFLIISIVISFLLLYVTPLLFWKDFKYAKKLFIIVPVIISLVFLFKVTLPVLQLYQSKNKPSQRHFRTRLLTAYLALVSIVLMPVVVSFGDNQLAELFIVNSGYMFLTVAIISNRIYLTKKRNAFFKKRNYLRNNPTDVKIKILLLFENASLTKRQIEIGLLIYEDYSYKEISEKLNIAYSSVSKHASDIFKKYNVKSKSALTSLISAECVEKTALFIGFL